MKTPKLATYLSSLTVAILAITSIGANAEREDTDTGTSASLIISLEAHAKLSPPPTPTVGVVVPVPVTGPNDGAALEATNVDGKKDARIELSERNLPADTYTVAVKKKSNGAVVTLGTFIVAAIVPPVVGAAIVSHDDNGESDGDSDHGGNDGKHDGRKTIKFGTKSGTPLPAGFDGFDVASITVSDSKGHVALGGDLTQNSDLVKRARLVADVSAPKASGYVSIFSSTRAGITTPRFSLIASGLTPGAALQLAINGADVQAVTPDTTGHVNVHSLPANVSIPGITKVAIHNAANVKLLSVSL